ncbi:hypothetical protein EH165_02690 [Nakamurella antarctica]|uniref:Uncharacterized protein n=1 Tax=Nakamurella antarctica TaxID=1902245 RepID=A0A3G8ZKB6_9ACTN|nr:hypothetical protein [Nakamurella antarctica]AZI57227.1 hypothetical protein EH165_02690 [Nakamurella antarctica]
MHRRMGALIVIACALAVLTGSRLLYPGLPGQGVRAALPEPPPVGSCLEMPARSVIACDQPHDVEVTAAWRADGIGPDPSASDPCSLPAVALLHTSAQLNRFGLFRATHDSWNPVGRDLIWSQTSGPVASAPTKWDWHVCVAGPYAAAPYSGKLQDILERDLTPSAFGDCYSSDGLQRISCTEPHQREYLSRFYGFVPSDSTADGAEGFPVYVPEDGMKERCTAISKELMATADPTFAGRLDLKMSYSRNSATWQGATGTLLGFDINAECYVQAPASTVLTASLVGISAGPLPLQ